MKLNYLYIQGFRSFRAEQELQFPGPGLYLVRGENRVEPALGSNGSGKTSLWDALSWVFYGRTVRGQKATTVVNWDETDLCVVVAGFVLGGDEYEVTRTQGPNSLTLARDKDDPKTVIQEEIDDLVGMDHSGFLSTVMMGQFNNFFFDLTAAEKLQVFTHALGLEVWTRAADLAKKEAKALDKSMRDQEQEVSRLEGRRTALTEQLTEVEQQLRDYDTSQKVLLKNLGDAVRAAINDYSVAELAKDNLGRKLTMALDRVEDTKRRLITFDGKVKAAEKRHLGFIHKLGSAEKLIAWVQGQLTRLEGLEGRCTLCGQRVAPEQVEKEVRRLTKELRGYQEEKEGLEAQVDTTGEAIVQAQDQLEKVDKQLTTDEGAATAVRERFSRAKSTLQGVDTTLRRLRAEKQACVDGGNPYAEQYQNLTSRLGEVRGDLRVAKADLKANREVYDGLVYWSTGFKELRLWYVDRALKELAIEVNNSLVELGLHGWVVSFDIERENTAGGFTRGFTVTVKPPEGPACPWESWSGGETQRLRIAGALGLSALIRNWRGVDWGLEVWDEPTDHLSPQGIDDLLRFFEGRAREEGRSVWLVDHRSLEFGGFDGEVLVVKSHKGSRIVRRVDHE